jgi:hypothetical protein
MMEYSAFPPCPYFIQILRHFPDAAMLYYKLWASKNKKHSLSVKKQDIFNIFLVSPTIFRNRMANLMEEGMLSFESTPEFYYIELIAFDEIEDEDDNDDNPYEL